MIPRGGDRLARRPGSADPAQESDSVTLVGLATQLTPAVEETLRRAFVVERRPIGDLDALRPESVVVLAFEWLEGISASTVESYREAAPCVLVTHHEEENLCLLGRLPRVTAVVTTARLDRELIEVVREVRHTRVRARLRTEVASLDGTPPILRVLAQRALARTNLLVDSETPVSTMDDATRLVGCSRSYLRDVARRAGVRVPALLDAVRLFAAVELHLARRWSWERVARRLGYQGASGLTALFRRVLGTTPSAVDDITMESAALQVLAALDRDRRGRSP